MALNFPYICLRSSREVLYFFSKLIFSDLGSFFGCGVLRTLCWNDVGERALNYFVFSNERRFNFSPNTIRLVFLSSVLNPHGPFVFSNFF